MTCFVVRGGGPRAALPLLLTTFAAGQAAPAPAGLGRLELDATTVATADGGTLPAERGVLIVPERHGRDGGGSIELAFLRIRCTGEDPGPPLFLLAGGPGSSGIEKVRDIALRGPWPLDLGDVIGIDQRGVGASKRWCLLGDAINFPAHLLLDAADGLDCGAEFRRPLATDVPVLLVAGDLDCRTPVRNARELLASMPNGHLVVVENRGHDLPWGRKAIREQIIRFVRGAAPTVTHVTTEPVELAPPR
ncbi:MAG: alpha/beta hydrolase [Planctomycetota bacterium]